MSAVVSALGKKYKIPAPTITFVRSIFNLAINLVCCAIVRVNPIGPVKDGRKYLWIILRGLFGGIQITCYFFAFTKVRSFSRLHTKIPVGDATTLTFTAPVITGLLAICHASREVGMDRRAGFFRVLRGCPFHLKARVVVPRLRASSVRG